MVATVETELRFRIPQAALERVRSLPRLAGGTAIELEAAYYDTPDHRLMRSGIGLRVRREGERWVQTVKWSAAGQTGAIERNELELERPGPEPDLGGIAHADLDALLRDPHLGALQEVFRTRITRTVTVLTAAEGSIVEAALDEGEILGGGRSERVCELELELKAGSTAALFDLAREFVAAPLFLDPRSKAARGYSLSRDDPASPQKAPAPPLVPRLSVSDAFAAIAGSTLAHLQANEQGVLAGREPEYLHQMRVALRRLRSALSVFGKAVPAAAREPIVAELRWLGAALGPARDWDVFVTETLPPLSARFPDHPGLQALTTEAKKRQKAAYHSVKAALRSPRYQRVLLDVSAWLTTRAWRGDDGRGARAVLDGPVRAYAERELEARYQRVRKRGRKGAQLALEELHQLRIAIKKLRYAADFFGALFDEPAVRRLRTRLSRLQDVLGTINDAATLQSLVDEGFSAGRGAAVTEARGILLGWSAGRAEALRDDAGRAFRKFRRTGTFW